MIPVLLYNGEPGPLPRSKSGRKAVQLGFCAFIPLHLLVLPLTFR